MIQAPETPPDEKATARHGAQGAHRLRRLLQGLGRIALTLAVIGVAVAAGVTAYGTLGARAGLSEAPTPAPRLTVRTATLDRVETMTVTRRFTGQFEAAQAVAVGFEEGGTIAEVLVREGDAVAAGDLIARLDTRLLEAERTRLEASRRALSAQAELARRIDQRQAALLAEGHVTQQRVDETSLRLAQLTASIGEVDAALVALDVRLSKAEARAPFDGRIASRILDTGAVAGPGAAVVTLLEDGPVRFRVALDPALAETLSPGSEVAIEATGRRFTAHLAELSPELDATTRGRVALFDLAPASDTPPARATGDVVLPDVQSRTGAWVPLAALWQGARGSWSLMTAVPRDDAEATIAIEAVEVLHVDGGRAFVRGAFDDGIRYLTDGTHRVVPGETVRLAEAE